MPAAIRITPSGIAKVPLWPVPGPTEQTPSSNTPPGTGAAFATTMKLYGALTSEALQNAAGTLGDAFERPRKIGQTLQVHQRSVR
jgi:hypothetical protein